MQDFDCHQSAGSAGRLPQRPAIYGGWEQRCHGFKVQRGGAIISQAHILLNYSVANCGGKGKALRLKSEKWRWNHSQWLNVCLCTFRRQITTLFDHCLSCLQPSITQSPTPCARRPSWATSADEHALIENRTLRNSLSITQNVTLYPVRSISMCQANISRKQRVTN